MVGIQRTVGPSGELTLEVFRGGQQPKLVDLIRDGLPHRGLAPEVNEYRSRNARILARGARKVVAARMLGIPHFYGALRLRWLHGEEPVDLGLVSLRVVTTAAVNRLVDGLQASATDLSLWKYHGYGTGTTAEAVGDTALVTELTTEYAADNTRPTGTQAEGAAANVYRTVATVSPDGAGTLNVTEHGIFTQEATGGGVLLDRSVFTAVPLERGSDSLQTTYDLTVAAGS